MALLILILIVFPSALFSASRRALIVGINQYQPIKNNESAKDLVVDERPVVQRPPVSGRGGSRNWTDLDGSFNDAVLVRQYLIDRLGFRTEDIVFLTDAQHTGGDTARIATARNILDTFRRHLVDAAAPGDVSFFFYAGHGSRIANRKTEEADGMDETLVPADAAAGTPDIRDKELARLYRAAVRKGITLTVVLDSCHSGGAARGVRSSVKTRDVPADTRYVEDAPDLDPVTGKPLPDPAAEGVLVIAAAQDDQAAREVNADGEPHGAFTWYFVKALQTSPVNEPVERLFAKTQAMMIAGNQMQLPSLNVNRERSSRGLLGQSSDTVRGLVIPLLEVRSNGTVLLRGGKALGLDEGCELVSVRWPKDVRVRITGSNLTLATAEARLIARPDSITLQPGDQFRLEKWVLPPSAATSFYMPTTGLPSRAESQKFASALIREFEQNQWKLVDEPALESPGMVLYWEGKWKAQVRGKASSQLLDLGLNPQPAAIVRAVAGHRDKPLFIDFPPAAELASEISTAAGQQTAMILKNDRRGAIYELTGRWKNGSLEYCWVLSRTSENPRESPLPDRTRWVDDNGSGAAQLLQELAFRITRVRLWLQMDAPGGTDAFPYEMILRNVRTKAEKTGGVTVEGEEYQVWFRAAAGASISEVTPKWIYIASIDSSGRMLGLYPSEGMGNTSEGRFPKADSSEREFRIPSMIRIQPEFGVDTLIAIISDEPINTAILYSDGVRGSRGKPGTPLEQFLFAVQGSRGQGLAVSGFAVQRLTTRSVARAGTGK